MFKRKYLILLSLVLLLSGCLNFGSGPGTPKGELVVQFDPGLLEIREIKLEKADGDTWLISAGSGASYELPLPEGIWTITLLARDREGRLAWVSSPRKVEGGKGAILAPPFQPVFQGDLPEPHNFKKSWAEGAGLTWDLPDWPFQEGDNWVIWRYEGPHWLKIGEQAYGQTEFFDKTGKQGQLYAVSFLTARGEEGPLRGEIGQLIITRGFQHEFPQLTQAISPLTLVAKPSAPGKYFDLIAHFTDEAGFQARQQILGEKGLKIKKELPELLAVLVEPKSESEISLAEWSIYQSKEFYLEPNWVVRNTALPSNLPESTWYLEALKVPKARLAVKTGHKVRIGVLDTGVNPEGLAVEVLPGYNFAADNQNTRDDHRDKHGTKVAGLIGEVMPAANILPVKVLDASGFGGDFQIAQGILYAAGLLKDYPNLYPAHIINLSLGKVALPGEVLQKAVRKVATETDIVMFAASGNTLGGPAGPEIHYPAAYPEIIAVGAVDWKGNVFSRADYSHYGPELDVVAPAPDKGTSFSTALVSGIAGLMLAKGLPSWEIRPILQRTAIDLGQPGHDLEHGFGMVNAYWAVQDVQSWNLAITDQGGNRLVSTPVALEAAEIIAVLPYGEYEVAGWLNLGQGKSPAPGDYYQTMAITIENREETLELNLIELD